MKLNKLVLGVAFVCAVASSAYAQSSPGFTYGQVPTAGQWNSYFAAKQDVLGYTSLNQAGGTMLGPLKTFPSSSTASGFSLLPGVAPNLPNNGDVWLTSTGLYYRAGNITFGPIGAGTITGPSTSTVGNPAVWGNTSGTALTDNGPLTIAGGGSGSSTAAGARTNFGLGTAAVQNIGTSGANVPLLSTTNTWSANQTIQTSNPYLLLGATASGQTRAIFGFTNGATRWALVPGDATSETGSNAGSNFLLNRYNDAGSFVDTPLQISRATGIVTLSQALPVTSGGTGVTSSTGTGNNVLSNSPVLVTPVLGAASGTSLNLSGLNASSAVVTDASKNLVSVANTGTGNNVLATSPTLITPNLGTPSAITLTSGTGLPISTGVTGLGTGVATALGNAVNTTGGVLTAFPACTTYTPTVTFAGGSGTSASSVSGAYCQLGKLLFVRVQGTITYTTVPANVQFSVPSGFTGVASQAQQGSGINSTLGSFLEAFVTAGGSNIILASTTAGSPLTASGQVLAANTWIEVQ